MSKKKITILGFNFIEENNNLTKEFHSLIEEKGLHNIAEVEQNVETLEFLKHGVILAPGIIVDGEKKSAGRIPHRDEIRKWLEELEDSIKDAELKLETMGEDEIEEALRAGELNLLKEEDDESIFSF